jgi:hypothetical protein
VGSCDDPEVVDETDSLSGIASMLHLVNAWNNLLTESCRSSGQLWWPRTCWWDCRHRRIVHVPNFFGLFIMDMLNFKVTVSQQTPFRLFLWPHNISIFC